MYSCLVVWGLVLWTMVREGFKKYKIQYNLMTNWKESDQLEKNIILILYKKPNSVTGISEKLKRAKPTISKTIERMQNQDLVKKNHEYTKDARKVEISINRNRVKIEKTHRFYLTYFFITSFTFIISIILTNILKKPFLFIGSGIGILPPVLFIFYQAYIKEDKVLVYKNPKITKIEEKKESKKIVSIG